MTESGLPPTVTSVSDRWANFLITVPSVGFGVCDVCRGPVGTEWAVCWACHRARRTYGDRCADAVAAVTLAPRGSQIARSLAFYKRDLTDADERRRMTVGLAATLWRWLASHEGCVARTAGVAAPFDMVTSVPSTSGRAGTHPLEAVVAHVVHGTRNRYERLVVPDNVEVGQRDFALDRFRAVRAMPGESVLLVDDTWTTGAHAQSTCVALKAAGASAVAVVTIGRWLTPSWENTAAWLQEHRSPWTWDGCCLNPTV